MSQIIQNLERIKKNIDIACEKSNRASTDVQIIAVTKQVSIGRAEEVIEVGLNHLGENRPEGLLPKVDAIGHDVKWHFIGSLQSRKVKEVIDHIDYLHSLDRLNLAKEIQKRASKIIDCFIQVNVSGEEAKHGLSPIEVIPFIEELQNYDKIRVIGLMTMAPNTDDVNTIREVFRGLKTLQAQAIEKKFWNSPCTELSMGMSNDFEIAIEEGATFVRIGTALVGNESGD